MANKREGYHREYRKSYNAKHKNLNVVLALEDFKRLEKSAKLHGTKPTPHLRELAFAQLDQQTLIPEALEAALKEHNLLVRNIANNLNQMAHSANIFHNADQNMIFNYWHCPHLHIHLRSPAQQNRKAAHTILHEMHKN